MIISSRKLNFGSRAWLFFEPETNSKLNMSSPSLFFNLIQPNLDYQSFVSIARSSLERTYILHTTGLLNLNLQGQRPRPHRLVARTSRCGRDNPGSTPGVDRFGAFPKRHGHNTACFVVFSHVQESQTAKLRNDSTMLRIHVCAHEIGRWISGVGRCNV